jgi:hypothetical protein
MKLEDQVTSVAISNQLHKLGVSAPSVFFREWTGAKETEIETWRGNRSSYCPDNVSCYTVAELGELLPKWYSSWLDVEADPALRLGRSWVCQNDKAGDAHFEVAATEADARAKMLI